VLVRGAAGGRRGEEASAQMGFPCQK
jgi:hypothetical protein